MMVFSLVAMTGLEKCCIKSAYLQWLCHSGERPVARGPLFYDFHILKKFLYFKANIVDPDQRPLPAASDLGIHCLLTSFFIGR